MSNVREAPSQLSFRDPAGFVVAAEGRVFRAVWPAHERSVTDFIDSEFFRKGVGEGYFPDTRVLDEAPEALAGGIDGAACVLEHEAIAFPVHPHEWLPGMLYDAGELTLDLAEEAAARGWSMKDATPWNVVFSDGRPVFCDVLSFEREAPSLIWRPYAQFQRTFVLPLYAHRYGIPVHSTFVENREGLDPGRAAHLLRGWRRWAPFELQTIVLPAKLASGSAVERSRRTVGNGAAAENPRLGRYVVERALKRLRRQLEKVRPRTQSSTWTRYEHEIAHYSGDERAAKASFVERAVEIAGVGRVLDLGANAGEYSVLAARRGRKVVSTDIDVGALEQLYKRASTERLAVTPLVLNLARPTPAVGWANSEVASFLDRARGTFELVLVLALLHHLLVTERVPLRAIVKLLFELEAPYLVIEWIAPADVKFRQIAATNESLYETLNEHVFADELGRYFDVVERAPLGGTRSLYLCRRKPGQISAL